MISIIRSRKIFFLNYGLHELVTGRWFGRKEWDILNNLYENYYQEKNNFQLKVKLTFDVIISKQSNLYISTVAKKKRWQNADGDIFYTASEL